MQIDKTQDLEFDTEQITVPLELLEDTIEFLLNPKRIISDSDEVVLDWNKRTQIYTRLFQVIKENHEQQLVM